MDRLIFSISIFLGLHFIVISGPQQPSLAQEPGATHDPMAYYRVNFNQPFGANNPPMAALLNLRGSVRKISALSYSVRKDSSKGALLAEKSEIFVMDEDHRILEIKYRGSARRPGKHYYFNDFYLGKLDSQWVFHFPSEEVIGGEVYQRDPLGRPLYHLSFQNGDSTLTVYAHTRKGDTVLVEGPIAKTAYWGKYMIRYDLKNGATRSTYAYHENGYLKTYKQYSKNGFLYLHGKSDTNGNLLQVNLYNRNENGELYSSSSETFTYDENQLISSSTKLVQHFDKSGQLTSERERQIPYVNGRKAAEGDSRITYNEWGDILRYQVIDDWYPTYIYTDRDSQGNWIRRIALTTDKMLYITERNIEYFSD